jgi:hypothetical protein
VGQWRANLAVSGEERLAAKEVFTGVVPNGAAGQALQFGSRKSSTEEVFDAYGQLPYSTENEVMYRAAPREARIEAR